MRHNIEIRTINNPTVASKCSGKIKNHVSHFNQELEMIKLSEVGISKALICLMLGILHKTVKM